MPRRAGVTPTRLVAVEIDPVLAANCRGRRRRARRTSPPVTVLTADALAVREQRVGAPAPTVLAANLPYNVAVPVVLHLLAALPSLERGLVMVQAEVADRMTAPPGSRVYGVPSVKLAWYADARPGRDGAAQRVLAGAERGLQAGRLHPPRPAGEPASREEVFAVIDAAFAQRRKTLRAALARWAGSAADAEAAARRRGRPRGPRRVADGRRVRPDRRGAPRLRAGRRGG